MSARAGPVVTWPSRPRGHRSNPHQGEPGGGGAAADQARGGDSAAGRPAAEQAPPRGTAACTVTPRVRARARLRPPRPARRAASHRARSASGLPPRQPARGCWAVAGADAAPSSRGMLVPCARSAAGRPVAPSPPLAWCCAAAAGFAMARVVGGARARTLGPVGPFLVDGLLPREICR